MAVWNLTAADCPAIGVPSTLLDPADLTPSTADTVVTTGAGSYGSGSLSIPFNGNGVLIDQVGRYGGGIAHCVKAGLELSDGGGLVANISEGIIGIDAGVHKDATTQALTNAAENYLWISITGAVTVQVGTTTPPAGRHVYLGRVTTAGGAITAIDYSGRLELRGGTLYRRTADTGKPGDTPPSGVTIFTRTLGGVWIWDGDRYVAGVRQVLDSQYTAVGNVGGGEDDLMTFTVPANVLGTDGESLEIIAFGDFAANGNNKRLRLKYGGTTILDTTALGINGDQWRLQATITRTGAATQIANAAIWSGDALLLALVANASPTETLSGTVVLKLTGEATANDDVRQLAMRTEWRASV